MAEQEELIALTSLHIEPNNCPLEEPISLAMDFELSGAAGVLQDSFWEVKFIADQTNKRKIVGAHCAFTRLAARSLHSRRETLTAFFMRAPILQCSDRHLRRIWHPGRRA